MASRLKKLSAGLNIDRSLSQEGNELSLADDNDDFLNVFTGSLSFGQRDASLNFGKLGLYSQKEPKSKIALVYSDIWFPDPDYGFSDSDSRRHVLPLVATS